MRLDPMTDSASGCLEGAEPSPESILPEQFFRAAAAPLPERQLMLAVLAGALLDLERSARAGTPRARRLLAEVEAWFAADDDTWPCSFVNLCHVLGLDVAAVRARLGRWRGGARMKILPLEGGDALAERVESLASAG